MEVVAGQQFGLTFFEPLSCLGSMALRAGPISAAVVTPERVAAVVAVVQSAAQLPGAAGGDVGQGPFLRGHHRLAVLGCVLGAEAADDIRQLEGGFPERKVMQVDLPKELGKSALPPETPDLYVVAARSHPLRPIRCACDDKVNTRRSVRATGVFSIPIPDASSGSREFGDKISGCAEHLDDGALGEAVDDYLFVNAGTKRIRREAKLRSIRGGLNVGC